MEGRGNPALSFKDISMIKRELHPICAAFPRMNDAELNELAADIQKNGLLEPITVMPDPDGRVLDGGNRQDACERAQVNPLYTVYTGSDPVAFAIAKNERRRHLAYIERVKIADKLANLKSGSNQHIGYKKEGVEYSTPSTNKAREDVANTMEVSVAAISDFRYVKNNAIPFIVDKVESGEWSPTSTARAINGMMPDEQKELKTKSSVLAAAKA